MLFDSFFTIMHKLIAIGDFLWGLPMLVFLAFVAVLYTVGTGGFQFVYFVHAMKNTFGRQFGNRGASHSDKGISSFRATCMALGNTLGVGNIAGVSLGIAMGGPGAVIWIWVAGLLGMIIKYGEITLGVKFRETDPDTGMYRGGIMWYVEKGLGRQWRWIAIAYAALYTLVMINAPAVQINTIASAATAYFDIPSLLVGVIAATLMALVLLGGLKRISSFVEKIVVFMTAAYLIVACIVFILYLPEIPHALGLIFKYAVSDAQAVTGGFSGATVAMAVRHGLARGFYSNGAGTGDSPFSHSTSDVDHPVKQGMWGVSEVVVDTAVCTSTALIILVTGAWESGATGAALFMTALSTAFNSQAFGNIFIIIMISFFAFSTAVVCAYYGEVCLGYFTRNKKVLTVYRCIICLFAAFATNSVFVERVDLLWRLGDFNVAAAIMLSLTSLVLLRKEVFASTREYKRMIQK